MRLQWRDAECFFNELMRNERSQATLEKYRRDLRRFYEFIGTQDVQKETVRAWKVHLIEKDYSVSTINSMLVVVNGLLSYLNLPQCRVKLLKRQRQAFSESRRELSRAEYLRLVKAAQTLGDDKAALVLEVICSTGIRVSELKFITTQVVKTGWTDLQLKGKCRRILLPKKLIKKLVNFIRQHGLTEGAVFRNQNGKPLSRHWVWSKMKMLSIRAGVNREKAFPHNLRHLFARTFYALDKDLAKLADLLGHSSIETTRLYIMTTSNEHLRQLNRMQLLT